MPRIRPEPKEIWVASGDEYEIISTNPAGVVVRQCKAHAPTCVIGWEFFEDGTYRLKGEPSPTVEPTIAEGSVVRLKSGGPRMTVAAIKRFPDDWGTTDCAVVFYVPEYGSEGAIREATFPLVCLTLGGEDSKGNSIEDNG